MMKRSLWLALVPALACADAPTPGEIEYLPVDEATSAKEDAAGARVEIKVTLPEADVPVAVRRFKLTDGKATFREVTFYDDPSLTLFDEGLVLRSRKVRDGADDSTVKVRPLAASDVDASWFELPGFKCEEDRVGSRSVSACSLTEPQDRGEIDAVADGERAIDKLFSRHQELFASAYGAEVDWSALEVLGPTETRVWSLRVSGFSEKLTFERWVLPDATELLEVSCRVDASRADAVQRDLARFLREKGFDPSDDQETKTRVALSYYASTFE